MKKVLSICLVLILVGFSFGQEENNDIKRIGISVNPLGFAQFGPLVNLDIKIVKNLVLNGHIRFAPYGLLTRVMWQEDSSLDEFTGNAYGGGLVYYFGDKNGKPYAGILFEVDENKQVYAKGKDWEWVQNGDGLTVVANGGYRFRFNSGFFMNVGAYAGIYKNEWKWRSVHNYNPNETSGSGTTITPFGMVEFTLGFELINK